MMTILWLSVGFLGGSLYACLYMFIREIRKHGWRNDR